MALKPLRYPVINGVAYSWASVEMSITCEATGKTYDLKKAGYAAVNFSSTRDRGEPGRGPHPDPLFKGRGQNKYTGGFKLYLSTLKFVVQDTLGGPGYGDRFFSVFVKYLENGMDPVTVEMRGCTLDSRKIDNASGTELTQCESDLSPLKIIFDGVDDVDDPLAA